MRKLSSLPLGTKVAPASANGPVQQQLESPADELFVVDRNQFGKSDGEATVRRKLPITAYFTDGHKIIDFVLAYQPDAGGKKRVEKARFRQKFETAMKSEGLELEHEGKEGSPDGKTAFVKIHASWNALCRQAEYEDLQMPIMESDVPQTKKGFISRLLRRFGASGRSPFELQEKFKLKRKEYFTDAFERDREDQFLIDDMNTFFSSGQRIYLTWGVISGITISLSIKKKGRHKNKDQLADGEPLTGGADGDADHTDAEGTTMRSSDGTIKTANIAYLLREKSYTAAFPLHDGEHLDDAENVYIGVPVEKWPLRKYLYESWAKPTQIFRHQPLDVVRDYFGEKVGIYFAWLGLYTKMLILPSFAGILMMIIGAFAAFSKDANEYCSDDSVVANLTICRTCSSIVCPFKKLSDSCLPARLTRVFDNYSSPFFSIFMAIWAVVFLEKWKRYQSELCTRWDVSDQEINEGQTRPDYSLKVTSTKLNPITKRHEPFLPQRSLYQRVFMSLASVFFFICVVLALLATVMIYKVVGPRIWLRMPGLQSRDETGRITYKINPSLLTSLSASLLNGVFIALMTKVYMKIAWKLTETEMPRTERQFEDSYTYKVFIFQFVNFYGALFFLSFIRGNLLFTSPPRPNDEFASRCSVNGCLLDVSIQLFIIMTGKQMLNNTLEIGVPLLKNLCRARKGSRSNNEVDSYTRWEKDFDLEPPSTINLFGDYLEMLIQFGFVTMFVPAFPLAPLFALLNNIIEIRLDAYKVVTQIRRCVPVRAKDLGPWFDILDIISKLAVITNAVFIAFTTDFVDRTAYEILPTDILSAKHSLRHHTEKNITFVGWTLTEFRTIDWCTPDVKRKIKQNESYESEADFSSETNQSKNIENDSPSCLVLRDYDSKIEPAKNGSSEAGGHRHKVVKKCWFRDYRNTYKGYSRSRQWYSVVLLKLGFIIVFEHTVLLVQAILGFIIPDVPDHVIMRLERERFLQRQAFKAHEMGDETDANKVDQVEVEDDEPDEPDAAGADMLSMISKLPPQTALRTVLTASRRPAKLPIGAFGTAGGPRKRPFLLVLAKRIMFC